MPSTSSTATTDDRDYALATLRGGRNRRAPTCSCCATPTAGTCPRRSLRDHRGRAGAAAERPLGIHTHDDTEPAVSRTRWRRCEPARRRCRARSTATASAAATPTWSAHRQPRAQARGDALPDGSLARLHEVARFVAEVANRARTTQPTSATARSPTRRACMSPPAAPSRRLPAHRPVGCRQPGAWSWLRAFRPGQRRVEGGRTRPAGPRSRHRRKGGRVDQGEGTRGLFLRGGRGERGAAGPAPLARLYPSVHAARLPRHGQPPRRPADGRGHHQARYRRPRGPHRRRGQRTRERLRPGPAQGAAAAVLPGLDQDRSCVD